MSKTAFYWVTSTAEEAVNWRKQASGEAFLRMVNRCVDDHQREQGIKLFAVPPAEVEQPPVRTGRYFTLPTEPAKGKVGKFFTISQGDKP